MEEASGYNRFLTVIKHIIMINNLYDTDYAQWTRSQIEALKAQDLKNIDFEHLIENLEMGDPKETVESNLIILIAHLLKLAVQKDAPDWMTNSWYNSIDEHRKRVLKAQRKYKPIKKYLPTAIENAYPDARDLAIKEGKRADGRKVIKRDESEYPEKCPFTFEQILDETLCPN